MKKKNDSNTRALESYPVFPYLAWTTIFIFAFFVYGIAMELKTVGTRLQDQNQHLQDMTGMNPEEFKQVDLDKRVLE